jgi:hypothetical protein
VEERRKEIAKPVFNNLFRSKNIPHIEKYSKAN